MREIPRFIKYIPHLTCPATRKGMYAKNGVEMTSTEVGMMIVMT
jgi:hypothetical protein